MSWLKYLRLQLPRTGRTIQENGEAYNLADDALQRRKASTEQASRDGELFRTFWQGTILQGTTQVFILAIPPGLKLIGFYREFEVRNGEITVEFRNGGTFDPTPLEQKDAYNFDETLTSNKIAQSKLQRVSGYAGGQARTPLRRIVAPAVGATRAPSTQTIAGAQATHDAANLPVFVVNNPGGTDADVDLTLYWQEILTTE